MSKTHYPQTAGSANEWGALLSQYLPPPAATGNVWFCQSTGANAGDTSGKGRTPDAPFATLAFAMTQATASNDDRIYLLPGHAEAVSAAAGIACSKAGVSVVGVGSQRPTITLDTANTATISVSAASVSFENCVFVANFLSIATCFVLTTAKHFTLRNCTFSDAGASLDFLNCVKSTGAANTVDGLTVIDCKWNGLGTTSVNALILSANDVDSLTVLRNRVKLARTADAAMIVISAGVVTNAEIGDNCLYTAQTATSAGSLINVGGTTSTGWVYRNFVQTLTTSSDKLFTVTVGLGAFENRVTGAVGATGFVIPAVDT